ncbi:hypothetical protein CLOM_g5803 [Closterium sp. NIES-68]|nr:hypothetical protein CLOM_g5803 [Closterium sp. NIES-68]GJP73859.1 hypothetical protein CLOP_g4534 [Closterium sp. NIES-67]
MMPDQPRSSRGHSEKARADMMPRGTSPAVPGYHMMFPSCDLVVSDSASFGSRGVMRLEQRSSRRGDMRLRAFHHITNPLVHVSSSNPDVWWSLPDAISDRLPLPPGHWQRIEDLSQRLGVDLSPDLLLRCLAQDMYYYELMPGAQRSVRASQPLNHALKGGVEEGSKNLPLIRARVDEPITYFTAHSRLRSHLEAVGDSVLGFTCVLHLVRQQPPMSMGELTARKNKLVSNRSLSRIGADVLNLPAAMLCPTDALTMQGKRAGVAAGTDKVEPSLVACTVEALVGAVYAERGLDAASALVTRLLPSLQDPQPGYRLEQRPEYQEQPDRQHQHRHQDQDQHQHQHQFMFQQESMQHLHRQEHEQHEQQNEREEDHRNDPGVSFNLSLSSLSKETGTESILVSASSTEEDPVSLLQQLSQRLGHLPSYIHAGTDNPRTPHETHRVRVYVGGRRMGTGMGRSLKEAKRDGAGKALLAWSKVFGEGGGGIEGAVGEKIWGGRK